MIEYMDLDKEALLSTIDLFLYHIRAMCEQCENINVELVESLRRIIHFEEYLLS